MNDEPTVIGPREREGSRDGGVRGPDDRGPHGGDRGVSEFTGVAILVGITVLVTASVGLSVLVVDQTEGNTVNGNFSFQYFDRSSTLIITFERGTPVPAGNLSVHGQGQEAPWHVLAGSNESATVGPDSPRATVQISRRNAFGAPVSAGGGIEVTYVGGENATVLERWEGS